MSEVIPVPEDRELSKKDFDLITPGEGDEEPKIQASGTSRRAATDMEFESDDPAEAKGSDQSAATTSDAGPVNTEDDRERLFALPRRPANIDRASLTGQLDSMMGRNLPGYETFKSYFSGVLRFDDSKMDTAPLRKGARVVGGTILGRVGPSQPELASHVNFAITPAGRGAHTIDPKPILDGWKLLEATAIYRAAGKDPFGEDASVGDVLLASKSQLQKQVLNDPNLEIYACGREDIASGLTDRRILASLAYLSQRGFRVTVTSLACGRSSLYTASGNLSAHPTGDAVDIAADQRAPDPRQPGSRLHHRGRDQRAAQAPGPDGARADHLPDGDGRTDLRDGRPRRPHPPRLHT